jgi:hypothetical protein
MKLSTLAAAASLVALAAPALAQDGAEDSTFVRAHAIDMLDGQLTEQQIALLQSLAYQTAIASVCEGIVLDDEKFIAAFGRLAHEKEAEMSAEQKEYYNRHLLVVYGVMVGGDLADVAANPGEACGHAATIKADAAMLDDLVWE